MLLVADPSVGPRFCFLLVTEDVDDATKSILLLSEGVDGVSVSFLITTEGEKDATFNFLNLSDSSDGATIAILIVSYLLVHTKMGSQHLDCVKNATP